MLAAQCSAVVGLAVTTAIAGIEGAIVAFLKIPSFVVTLAGLLTLSGVLLWLYEQTGGGPARRARQEGEHHHHLTRRNTGHGTLVQQISVLRGR